MEERFLSVHALSALLPWACHGKVCDGGGAQWTRPAYRTDARSKEAGRKCLGPHIPFKAKLPKTQLSPIRLHPLKALPPPSSTVGWEPSLQHQIQTTTGSDPVLILI